MALPHPSQLSIEELEQNALKDPDIYFASRLISQVQAELVQKKRHLIGVTAKWAIAYDFLKQREASLLEGLQTVSEEDQYFLGLASVVHGLGVLLLRQLKINDDVDVRKALGYDYDDIEACIDDLAGIVRIGSSDQSDSWDVFVESNVFGSEQRNAAGDS